MVLVIKGGRSLSRHRVHSRWSLSGLTCFPRSVSKLTGFETLLRTGISEEGAVFGDGRE